MPMANKFPSPEELHNLLRYEGGNLFWRERGNGKFDKQFANKEAGCKKRPDGYSVIAYGKSHLMIHRVVWTMFNRQMVKGEDIDHINGNRADNRIENLRLCSRADNLKNAQRRKDNTSGIKGVGLHDLTGKWRARISIAGKQIYLGLFQSLKEAESAIIKVRDKAHGRFANHGTHLKDLNHAD